MIRSLLTIAALLGGLAAGACKYESSTWFDNNCTGNALVLNEAHCASYGQ